MRIEFSKPVDLNDDVTVKAVVIDHLIIYPAVPQIVQNNKDGSAKVFPFEGLSDKMVEGYNAFMALFSDEVKGEYEEGATTARIVEKRAERQALIEEAKEQVAQGEV